MNKINLNILYNSYLSDVYLRMSHIFSHRIQKIITYLTIVNLSSKQIETKLAELYRVVDMHNQAIELVN